MRIAEADASDVEAAASSLEAYCRGSATDPMSTGVCLDMANPLSLDFYLPNRFALRGQSELEGIPIWCLLRSDDGEPGRSRPTSPCR